MTRKNCEGAAADGSAPMQQRIRNTWTVKGEWCGISARSGVHQRSVILSAVINSMHEAEGAMDRAGRNASGYGLVHVDVNPGTRYQIPRAISGWWKTSVVGYRTGVEVSRSNFNTNLEGSEHA